MTPDIWNPVDAGAIRLPHRLAMAPMTRDRSTPEADDPGPIDTRRSADRAERGVLPYGGDEHGYTDYPTLRQRAAV